METKSGYRSHPCFYNSSPLFSVATAAKPDVGNSDGRTQMFGFVFVLERSHQRSATARLVNQVLHPICQCGPMEAEEEEDYESFMNE